MFDRLVWSHNGLGSVLTVSIHICKALLIDWCDRTTHLIVWCDRTTRLIGRSLPYTSIDLCAFDQPTYHCAFDHSLSGVIGYSRTSVHCTFNRSSSVFVVFHFFKCCCFASSAFYKKTELLSHVSFSEVISHVRYVYFLHRDWRSFLTYHQTKITVLSRSCFSGR